MKCVRAVQSASPASRLFTANEKLESTASSSRSSAAPARAKTFAGLWQAGRAERLAARDDLLVGARVVGCAPPAAREPHSLRTHMTSAAKMTNSWILLTQK